jgi:hypothetical protein
MVLARKKIILVVMGFVGQLAFAGESPRDTFGIEKFYPTKEGSIEWNSAHWSNGHSRSIDWDGDPDDVLEWTDNRSAGDASPFFKIDGNGVMQMMSSGPRFHINSQTEWAAKKQFYRDVEFTAYYRRGEASANGPDYGGMVMGVRSGALGHASGGGNNCDASTYYARFRHDGKWDFEKEWKHPGSYYQSEGVVGKQTPLWGGAKLPTDRWIGMKFIVYNVENLADLAGLPPYSVRLELYIDSISNGEPANAKWEKVGEALDEGKDWSGASGGAATIDGCKDYNGLEDAFAPILKGGGIALMRTDGSTNNVVQGEYKYVSIREIDPLGAFAGGTTGIRRSPYTYRGVFPSNAAKFDLNGRSVPQNAAPGMYLFRRN